jgi:predicted ribosome quality control (RQC) complex YloA/Tae2 family protein
MSLNWKEINLILEELELPGMQIQKAVQNAFDMLSLKLYGRNGAKTLLISLSPGACRLHETFYPIPKNNKPLRFAEFLNSRIVNGRIEEAIQLGEDRIVRITVRLGEDRLLLFLRLWSNAANVIVTDPEGNVMDAMRRLPKKREVSGGFYIGANTLHSGKTSAKEFKIRDFPDDLLASLPPSASFNLKIDALYRSEGSALSLEALQEEARRKYEGSIDRVNASIERLREKEAGFSGAEQLKEYGDIILSNIALISTGDKWLEAENLYSANNGNAGSSLIRIKLDPLKNPAACAEDYYEQYRKAKSGCVEIQKQIEKEENELSKLKETLIKLLSETNPLILHKILRTGGRQPSPAQREDAKHPGLSFRREDWLIIVGRDAAENDALLRKYVKGNDLWLHARDYPGSYVFIKHRPGKTVPLDILLDAGNLALFYSKGRKSGEGDLFYTQVKYLRRAKGGPRGKAPKGLVITKKEKNLHVRVEAERLKELEECRVEK